jgi:hypothetical protein
MASLAAKRVAMEVLETIGKGKIPNVSKIAVRNGYSQKTAYSGIVQKTETYKAEIESFLERLQKQRDKVLRAMDDKDLDRESYKVLSDSLQKLTHDSQLLSGGKTVNNENNEDKQVIVNILMDMRSTETVTAKAIEP